MTDGRIEFDNVVRRFRVIRERPDTLRETFAKLLRRRPGNYYQFEALKGVSFRIQEGEAVGIVGKNGSGKSTILKTIAGVYKPTSGQVVVRGKVAALIELAAGFHPELTGRENIVLNGLLLGLSRREVAERESAIIDFAEIGDFIDSPVKQYSSGMYMRLGFAIAVQVNPDILLMDEILAVGDLAFQQKCFNWIDEFRRRGKTTILVAHAMGAVRAHCQRVLLIDAGRLIADGPPDEVISLYESLQQNASPVMFPAGELLGDNADELSPRPHLEEQRLEQNAPEVSSQEKPLVSVIIPARNEARNLERMLPALRRQKCSFSYEIIGIDTASTDGTAALFRESGARVVSVAQPDFHHVRTRLLAARQARGDLVVMMVADAIPYNDCWLQALVAPLLEDPEVAAAYSRQLPAEGCVPWEARDIFAGGNTVREVKYVDWSSAAAVENYQQNRWKFIAFSDVSACYRKKLILDIAMPEELSEIEDQYWCKHLIEQGYKVVFEPTSLVVHSHNDSLRRLYRRNFIYGNCFAIFVDAAPDSLAKVVRRAVQDVLIDMFFIYGSADPLPRKLKWALQAPLVRFIKRQGYRNGVRHRQRLIHPNAPNPGASGARVEAKGQTAVCGPRARDCEKGAEG